jgi:ElaA protein
MQLRNEVFVVEQNCVYQDADGKDAKSFHLIGFNQMDDVLAYCRILPAGISYEEVSIGRVVTSPKIRGKGIGKELMVQALDKIKLLYSNVQVRIGAQVYLKEFYAEMGFVPVGKEYMEDNIPHIEMIKKVML